jgi:hypothetical protein
MKTEDKKPIREDRKIRWAYGAGATVAMLISLGGIILAKTGHGGAQLFPDSFQSISLPSIIGWATGICGALVAVAIARRSKGVFILTRDAVAFKGIADKEHWSVKRTLIRSCTPVNSWFNGILGTSTIILTVENPEGGRKTFRIGPFPSKTAEAWLKDLRVIVGETAARMTKVKRPNNNDGRILEPINKVI